MPVLFLVAGMGCSSAPEPPARSEEEAPPALEGSYQSETGPLAWTSFKGSEYVSWRNADECEDYASAPDACAETGTFELDVEHETLTLTSVAGHVTTQHIAIKAVAARGTLADTTPEPASIGFRSVDLVGEQQLLSPNVVRDFQLTRTGQELADASTFRRIAIVCRVIGLVLNPPQVPVIVPQPAPIEAPAPVGRQQCSS